MSLNPINITSSTLIANTNNVAIVGNNYTHSSTSDLVSLLSSYKGFNIYKTHFHHIHSTYAGNVSFIVSSAGGWQDTVIRLWKVSTSTDGSTQYVNIEITNNSGITLASGTDATKIPSSNIYLKWLVVNDQVNGTQSSFEYPNFSSSFPLSSEQTKFYNSPPVVGENGSAFDFILENGEEYILEYGHSSDSGSGGSYQINIGSLTNIETALSVSSTIDPTGAFLGYVDIPSTLGNNQNERAYIYFNLDNSSLSSTGEKGTILLNRIRKQKPVIPEDTSEITPMNNTNTSLSIVQPIRNIPNTFKIDNGGENFTVGDHIVICNKYSIHEQNNIDLFTTYRDGIFTTSKKALYSFILKVTSVKTNLGVSGIIDSLEIVNFNDIMNINNPVITIPKLDTLDSTSTSYPDQTSPYYVFVFDKNYLTNTSSSNLNINCRGAELSVNTSQAITALTGGDLTLYDDANNADVSFSMGTSATEALVISVMNGDSNKTAESITFTTKTASSTADHGKFTFAVDETNVLDIDDGGINLVTGKDLQINGSSVLNNTTLGSAVITSSLTSVPNLDSRCLQLPHESLYSNLMDQPRLIKNI